MTNYDRWIEQPYQEREARLDFEEAQAEHEWDLNYTEVLDSLDFDIPAPVTEAYRVDFDNRPYGLRPFDAWLDDQTGHDILAYLHNNQPTNKD
jgi:hypothetical protein